MTTITDQLSKGDMRTTGAAGKVAKQLQKDTSAVSEVLQALTADDKGLAMRAADALEKASKKSPDILKSHAAKLLQVAKKTSQQEVQWHMAQIIPRLDLSSSQRTSAWSVMKKYHTDSDSRIVQTSALEALVVLAKGNASLATKAKKVLEGAIKSSIPSISARARKLSKQLDKE